MGSDSLLKCNRAAFMTLPHRIRRNGQYFGRRNAHMNMSNVTVLMICTSLFIVISNEHKVIFPISSDAHGASRNMHVMHSVLLI